MTVETRMSLTNRRKVEIDGDDWTKQTLDDTDRNKNTIINTLVTTI